MMLHRRVSISIRATLLAIACLVTLTTHVEADDEPPKEWVEASGHRVIRLSREPGSASLYFHQNPYTAEGDKLLIATPGGLSTVNLKSYAIEQVVEGWASQVVVGKKSRQVYYTKPDGIYATHLDTRATHLIAKPTPEFRRGSGLAVNADETLLAGSYTEASGTGQGADFTRPGPRPEEPTKGEPGKSSPVSGVRADGPGPNQERSLEARWAARRPMRLYTINITDGAIKTFHPSTDWLNHVQFSPTDSTLILFCHEGPWHKVDRIWTIRTDGSDLRKIHTRTMDMEIAGHEFFSPDGLIVYYDLQTPKSKVFWLAGHVLANNRTIKYRVDRSHWSVHYNVSPDGKTFAGDGGGPHSVAAPGNGQFLYLFTPDSGVLKAEVLVDLTKHDYRLEPNLTFTPDGKWIVFRSNMHGVSHVYAVELARSR